MIIYVILALFIDIISKLLIIKNIALDESIKIMGNFMKITHVHNTGAAWSLLANNSGLVLLISVVIIIMIALYIWKNKPNKTYEKVAYGFILGGAIGNFIDRIFYGYVIDFIDVKIFNYDFPIFNLADTFIVLGVIIMMIFTWRDSIHGNRSSNK